jgi:ribose transport system permease protein
MSATAVNGTPPASETTAPVDDRALQPASTLTNLLRSRAAWVLALDVVLVMVFTLISDDHVFFTLRNMQSLLLGATQALLLALGLAMMLGAGIFDLSLGANLVLSSVVGALVMQTFQDPQSLEYSSPWSAILLGFLACVLTGVVFGVVNGALIAIADVNSLIATLATLGIGTGLSLLLAGGADVAGMPFELQQSIGLKTVVEIPLPALFAVAAAVVMWAVVRYTRFGMRTQAIGSSRASAERAGIKVPRHYIILTSLAGALAGVAGFVDLARFGSTALAGHANDSLAAVTAVVIGGTLLTGGFISIVGAVWGAALAVILQTGLVIVGVPSFWQLIAVGVVLLLAVVIDRTTSKRRAARH